MATPPQLTPAQRQALSEAIYAGKKIEAIKQLRAISGLGLKESKDILDKLEAELRTEHPERFASKDSKNGCSMAVLLIVVVAGLMIFFLRR